MVEVQTFDIKVFLGVDAGKADSSVVLCREAICAIIDFICDNALPEAQLDAVVGHGKGYIEACFVLLIEVVAPDIVV